MSETNLRALTRTNGVRIQNRLTGYLKGLREKECLTQAQMAEKIGIKSTTHYNQKIERHVGRDSGSRDFNKVVQACDVLEQFGQLEGMDFSEFACYLKNTNSGEGRKSLFPWERDTLALLGDIDKEVKATFTSLVVGKARNGRMARFQQAIDLLYLLLRMDKGSFRSIAVLVHQMARLNKLQVKPISKKLVTEA